MQPLAEASVEKMVPMNSSTISGIESGETRRIEQRRDRLTQVLPRHQADADVPGHASPR